MKIDLVVLLVATKALFTSSFTIIPSTRSILKPSPTLNMASSVGLIDLGNIVKKEDGTTLSDGTVPSEMGVTGAFNVELPEEIMGEIRIFALAEGDKVKNHSHPGSGQYFVTNGSVKVTANAETKTYGKGDLFIVPKDVDYEVEDAGEGDAGIFYVYWAAERPK